MNRRKEKINLEKVTDEEILRLLEDSDEDMEFSDEKLETKFEDLGSRQQLEEIILDETPFEIAEEEPENPDPVSDPVPGTSKKTEKIKSKKPTWKRKDIDLVNTSFASQFSNTPLVDTSPYEYFKMFITNEMIENLSEQTNLYSVQKNGVSINSNKQEIEQFLGIHLLSGIIRVPSDRMYWAERTRFSVITDVMSRNRFDHLRNYLRINDNTNMLPRDNPNYDYSK